MSAARPLARLAAVLPVLTGIVLGAAPALAANNPLAPVEGADNHAAVTVLQGVLLFVVIPLVILFGVAGLVWLPGLLRSSRYRPGRGWSAPPVWFAGPADPVAAVENARPGEQTRGGASGQW